MSFLNNSETKTALSSKICHFSFLGFCIPLLENLSGQVTMMTPFIIPCNKNLGLFFFFQILFFFCFFLKIFREINDLKNNYSILSAQILRKYLHWVWLFLGTYSRHVTFLWLHKFRTRHFLKNRLVCALWHH